MKKNPALLDSFKITGTTPHSPETFARFISERGKITPRRISGVCAPHQRRLAESIKQARNIALLPFSSR